MRDPAREVWTPEVREQYRAALARARKRTYRLLVAGFVILLVGSISGSVYAGKVSGKQGASAARHEIRVAAQRYADKIVEDQRKLLLAGCRRSNDRIRNTNDRAHALIDVQRVLGDLVTAAIAQARSIGDSVTAASYKESLATLRAIKIPFDFAKPCEQAYPPPR